MSIKRALFGVALSCVLLCHQPASAAPGMLDSCRLPRVSPIAITNVKDTGIPGEVQIEFEIINYTNSPVGSLTMLVNAGSTAPVSVSGTERDFNGRPIGDVGDKANFAMPLPASKLPLINNWNYLVGRWGLNFTVAGDLTTAPNPPPNALDLPYINLTEMCNPLAPDPTVAATAACTKLRDAGVLTLQTQFDACASQAGYRITAPQTNPPIPSGNGDADEGVNNVLDGFVIKIQGLPAGKAVSFNWYLLKPGPNDGLITNGDSLNPYSHGIFSICRGGPCKPLFLQSSGFVTDDFPITLNANSTTVATATDTFSTEVLTEISAPLSNEADNATFANLVGTPPPTPIACPTPEIAPVCPLAYTCPAGCECHCRATGACSTANGSCQILPNDECNAGGGSYAGDGSSCVTGACLLQGQCTQLRASQCFAQGGCYSGDNSSVCTGTCAALKGSATLTGLINELIGTSCKGLLPAGSLAGLSYTAAGSSIGGQALIDQLAPQPSVGGPFEQIAAPQTRPLNASECSSGAAKLPGVTNTAEGIAIGLDGVVVVTNSDNTEFCGNGHAHRSAAPTAPFSNMKRNGNWKTSLRILYTGYDPGSNTQGRCKSADNPMRLALAEDWAQLFEGGCSQSSCTGVARAFRPSDRSSATEIFLSLIGAPSLNLTTGAPFCNGTQGEDNDPIRRTCSPDEQVCEADGTLGLVLPISIPTVTNVTTELYGPPLSASIAKLKPSLGTSCPNPPPPMTDPSMLKVSPCSGNIVYNLPAGCVFPNNLRCDCRFPLPNDFTQAIVAATGNPCLVNGQPLLPNVDFNWNRRAGGCPAVTDGGTPAGWGLLNGDNGTVDNSPATWGTRSVKTIAGSPAWRPSLPTASRCCTVRCPTGSSPASAFVREDNRVMNLVWRRNTNGRVRDFDSPTGNSFRPAFYRIHSNAYGLSAVGQSNPLTPVCQKADEFSQIGCLVQSPMQCSLGVAGRRAFALDNAEPLALSNGNNAGVDPTLANLQGFTYPMVYKLYYNSLIGFGDPLFSTGTAFEQAQGALGMCLTNNNPAVAQALLNAGFSPLPAGPTVEAMCP